MAEITVKNKRINYVKEGQGDTCVVLIHGWGGSHKSLYKLHCFLKEDYTSVVLDLPGFGSSDNPDPSWGIDEYAEFVFSFITEIGVKKAVLLGHSFGGAISIYIAAKYPNLVDKLVLCAPSFRRENPCGQTKKKDFWESIKSFTKLPFYEKMKSRLTPIRKVFYKLFYPGSEVLAYPHLEPNFRKIITQDLTPTLSNVKQSTLILWGDADSFVPLEHAYILKAKVKDSILKIRKGAGHGLPKFKPEWVYMEVKRFIDGD